MKCLVYANYSFKKYNEQCITRLPLFLENLKEVREFTISHGESSELGEKSWDVSWRGKFFSLFQQIVNTTLGECYGLQTPFVGRCSIVSGELDAEILPPPLQKNL